MPLSSKIAEFEANLEALDITIRQGGNDEEIQRIDANLIKLSNDIKNSSASTYEEAHLQINFFMDRFAEIDQNTTHSDNFEAVKLLLKRYLIDRKTALGVTPLLSMPVSVEL